MTTAKASLSAQPESTPLTQDTLVENIIGVAIFDFSGLPREYFITADNESTSWVQIVFQALGLKSLLMSSLKLEGFSHICIELSEQTAIVVRTKEEYVALLMRHPLTFATAQESDRFSQWVRQFEQRLLRQHNRFIPA
jgi:predicted regulator of Ras-like GTPase activity (Roadblock/LC7/MglB family)